MIVVNPGSGPVGGTVTFANAHDNMRALLRDAGFPDAKFRRDAEEDMYDGRFPFLVEAPPDEEHPRGCEVEVLMPGCPLKKVRFTGSSAQDIWDYPRLYVDGSSWVWCYAVDILTDLLTESSRGGEP